MMYNMISAAGVDVYQEGSPSGLAEKGEINTLLGAANSQQLPITFSHWSQDPSKVGPTSLQSLTAVAAAYSSILRHPQAKFDSYNVCV